MTNPYRVALSRSAARAVSDELPEAVAGANLELIAGPLSSSPRRIGRPLRDDLTGLWSARRGSFRVLYAIDDERRRVEVVRIDHRRDVYRRLD